MLLSFNGQDAVVRRLRYWFDSSWEHHYIGSNMKKFALVIVATFLLVIGVRAAGLPFIIANTTRITVSNIDKTAVGACTEFASVDEKMNGERYTPRHCFAFDGLTTLIDDWEFIPVGHTYDVAVEVYTETKGVLSAVRSNTVRVKH